MPTISGIWVAAMPDDDSSSDEGVIRKRASGKGYFAFDFGNSLEIFGGAVISSATISVSPSGPTIGTATLVGNREGESAPYRVAAWYEGGSASTNYTVTCTATLDDGSILVGRGTLSVV